MGKASINSLRGKLYLLARLPHKDGSPGVKPQRIALGLPDTPADRRVAQQRLNALQMQIDKQSFAWEDWLEPEKALTWKKAIDALYRKRVVLGRTGENTWNINYMGRLRQAPMQQPITKSSVVKFLSTWARDTASYKEAYYLMVEICSLAGLEFPEVPIPTYSKSELRNVPEDHEILEWFHKAPPELGWVIGMLAAYGMRPHELLGSEFADDNHRLNIPDGTKTGFRLVTPVPRDWVDVFDLRSERRPVINSTKKQALTQWFFNERKKIGLPFTPYAFRHAYAGRLWRFGGSKLDLFTAARLMGHSVAIHAKTYRQFIAPYTVAEAAEAAIAANMEQLEAKLKAPLS